MELQGYLLILRARWRIVASVTVLALLVAGAYSLLTPPTYVAQSRVFLTSSLGRTPAELSRAFTYTQGMVRAYAQVATEAVVLDPVIRELGLKTTASELARAITAQAPLDTVIIDIDVVDSSPRRAADVANAVARQLSVVQVAPTSATSASTLPVTVNVLSLAGVPSFATSPRRQLSVELALALGLLLGIVLAISRDALDVRVRGPRDARALTKVPVIGLVTGETPHGWRGFLRRRRQRPADEVNRELRANFVFMCSQRSLKSVVFTSARLDGATGLTVSRLATALGKIGHEVLVIDADIRYPTLAARHGLTDEAGLTSVLRGDLSAESAVRHSAIEPVSVLPAGPPLADPSVMTEDSALRDLIIRLAQSYDVVLIKAPPVLEAADGLVLGRISDGVVIVADEPAMNQDVLTEEIRTVEVAGANVLGMVLIQN